MMRAIKISIILILGLALGYYGRDILGYIKTFSKSETVEIQKPSPPPASSERVFPAGFSPDGLKEKELDLNNDGEKELFLTSFSGSRAQAVLIDPKDPSKALSKIFGFSQIGFSEKFLFKPIEAPEVYQTMDLNVNGRKELVLDLKDYGAYTTTYGIIIYSNDAFSWLMLEEKDGRMRPAIFRDGASVRNANIYKTLPEERALVEVSGIGDEEGKWTWEASAYKWSGEKYIYNQALSEKIRAEQPKKIIDGKPVF